MNRIARASELIGRPIITLDSATAVAEVKDVLIDTQAARAIGFTLRGSGLLSGAMKGVLPADALHAIGRDAVMIESAAAITDSPESTNALLAEQDEMIGKEALTASGASLGTVSDVILEIEGPAARVVGYELAANNGNQVIVPVSENVPMSADALIVPEDVSERATSGLASFRGALERTRS